MRRLALIVLIPLAACATPRQQCERAAVRELNTVSKLIVELEQNIARGYAIERRVEPHVTMRFCLGERDNEDVGLVFCRETEQRVVKRAVAIDIDSERDKLTALRAKRDELRRIAADALARCGALYPAS